MTRVRPRASLWGASLLVLLVSATLGTAPAAGAATRRAGPAQEDAIILIDVSESVRGGGTNPAATNIWVPLQQSVSELIDLMPNGTHFAIVPFSRGPDVRNVYPHGGQS